MAESTDNLEEFAGGTGLTMTMWSPNINYNLGDIAVFFKNEKKQVSPDVGIREFVFVLVSTKDNNQSMPNYDMVDGIPNFAKSGWRLLNPMSFLLQDLIGMKAVVKEVFANLLNDHVQQNHGLIHGGDIGKNLLLKDYSNMTTPWTVGKYSLTMKEDSTDGFVRKLNSNGTMEIRMRYSFDMEANQQIKIDGKRYFYQKSPIWDESDNTIFSHSYQEDNLFSVNVNRKDVDDGLGNSNPTFTSFNNLRYGTNIFHKKIEFNQNYKFINDEYMVFFDTYGNGEFVFGYDKGDLESKTEPTYDAIVSMPMLMNKTASGFDIVLPIHCHFNSIQKYNIGVPWNNEFRLQVIGRYR